MLEKVFKVTSFLNFQVFGQVGRQCYCHHGWDRLELGLWEWRASSGLRCLRSGVLPCSWTCLDSAWRWEEGACSRRLCLCFLRRTRRYTACSYSEGPGRPRYFGRRGCCSLSRGWFGLPTGTSWACWDPRTRDLFPDLEEIGWIERRLSYFCQV